MHAIVLEVGRNGAAVKKEIQVNFDCMCRLDYKDSCRGCFIIVHLQPFIRDFSSKGTAHTVTSVSCMSEKLASCATKR